LPSGSRVQSEYSVKLERVGGVRWTIKDGVVYDACKLLEDVAAMVERQRAGRGLAMRRTRRLSRTAVAS
jgi:hypothetical protein